MIAEDVENDTAWSDPTGKLFSALLSSEKGLTAEEASARLGRYGTNRIEEKPRQRLLIDFVKRFRNPLVIVLLIAAAIAAGTGDPASFGIIAAVIFLSVLLDFVQERRAQAAAEKLRERVALTAEVLRDGHIQEVKTADIVPGDVVSLRAGDLVPADCRLLRARDVFVNQALLTGESYPVEKAVDDTLTSEQERSALPRSAVFAGSSVVSGTAMAMAVHTGRTTLLGALAASLHKEPPPTAFALGLRDFSMLIVRLTVLLVFFVLLVNLLFHRPILESFLFALALAVGLTPELLPMIVSVTLAQGALRMAKKQVIVKRLSAIHDLGTIDVLCSDKTGTLTQAAIALVRAVDLDGNDSPAVLEAAYLNALFETGIKSPLDRAILNVSGAIATGWKKIDEVPFDFQRRRVSVLAEHEGKRRLLVKGAPEDMLHLSSTFLREAAALPFDDAAIAAVKERLAEYGRQGFRVLGVAWRDVPADCTHAGLPDESALVFAGLALFLDPPKESAAGALRSLAALGVTVKIITGDNEAITSHVCDALDLPEGGSLTGEDIAHLTDDALVARVPSVNKFCRVTPTQKERIITALRRAGHVVGYLGDGINDAPSLHNADVGISVDSAVDVAKDAAALILLENDLDVLADGVREGRRTFANVMKYVMMGTSSNFGNMFSMAGGVLFLPFLPMLPIQILLNNLLYDVSEIAIPMDRVDEQAIVRPGKWDMKFVRNFMFIFGPLSSVFDFLTFWLLLRVFSANEKLFHTGWFLESLVTQILVIFVIRTRAPFFRSNPSPVLIASSLGTVVAALLLPYTPLGHWFRLTAPSASLLAALAGITASYLLIADGVKRLFFRRTFAGA